MKEKAHTKGIANPHTRSQRIANSLEQGCHNGNGKQPETPAIEQTTPEADTLPTDTIDYERLRRLQLLLRGGGKWESEK